MKLDKIQIQQFRNLSSVLITPCPHLNLIFGPNGSGKSSILEALHYLGYGRSFRTTKHKNVVQQDQSQFTLFCALSKQRVEMDSGNNSNTFVSSQEQDTGAMALTRLGYQRNKSGDCLIKLNGEKLKKTSELAKLLPIQIFTPASVDIVLGAPSNRRKLLDWGVFHVEHGFQQMSSTYTNILKQRNALLRTKTKIDPYWNSALSSTAEEIDQKRQKYFNLLLPYLNDNFAQFLPEFSLEISYYRGWDKGQSMESVLNENQDRDFHLGFTSAGPHRADLKLKVGRTLATEVLSRGQCRMMVAAFLLAQTQLLKEQREVSSIFLLDDIGAELDEVKRRQFIKALINTTAQIFVTAIDKQQVEFLSNFDVQQKMFHVEHGEVNEE